MLNNYRNLIGLTSLEELSHPTTENVVGLQEIVPMLGKKNEEFFMVFCYADFTTKYLFNEYEVYLAPKPTWTLV